MRESSLGSYSSSESRTKGTVPPNIIDLSLSVRVLPLSARPRARAQPGKATGEPDDAEPGDGTVRALLRP